MAFRTRELRIARILLQKEPEVTRIRRIPLFPRTSTIWFFDNEGIAREGDLSWLQSEMETGTRTGRPVSDFICRLRNSYQSDSPGRTRGDCHSLDRPRRSAIKEGWIRHF